MTGAVRRRAGVFHALVGPHPFTRLPGAGGTVFCFCFFSSFFFACVCIVRPLFLYLDVDGQREKKRSQVMNGLGSTRSSLTRLIILSEISMAITRSLVLVVITIFCIFLKI